MKTLPALTLLFLLSLLHASAQDSSSSSPSAAPQSAPTPDLSAQDDLLKKREATVKKLRELMDKPSTTPDMKLQLAAAAFDLLDQDTAMLQADHDLIVSQKKDLDAKPSAPPLAPPDKPKPHGVHPPDARVPGIPAN